MISRITPRFRKAYERLPAHVKKQAQTAYRLWLENPYHQSLRFKTVHPSAEIYSVRIGIGWRALGIKEGNQIVWFWIGSHEDYDGLVSQI